MKIESAIEMLLPTIQFGNVKVSARVGLDTSTDLGRVDELRRKYDIDGPKEATETVAEITRRLALDELTNMKAEIDKLEAGFFGLEQFGKR